MKFDCDFYSWATYMKNFIFLKTLWIYNLRWDTYTNKQLVCVYFSKIYLYFLIYNNQTYNTNCGANGI